MIGALIIDKPEGMTSHDVVARVRRAARLKRVGHAGTLDPFATGVLVVCLGRATRLMRFLVGLEKTYVATVRLGFATDTQDLTGKQITPLRTSNGVTEAALRGVLASFEGEQGQLPPMFSAKKVGGERLYKAAREGRDVERQPAQVVIHSIELLETDGASLTAGADGTVDFRMHVRCSSGTYVRTLAHDIGARLGTGAHLRALRRTAVGHFGLDRALTLDELEARGAEGRLAEVLIEPAAVLAHLPRLTVGREDARRLAHGMAVEPPDEWLANVAGFVRLCDEAGELLAVGEIEEGEAGGGPIWPSVVLAEPPSGGKKE